MSLTKEMIMSVDSEVQRFTDEQLLNYYYSYRKINNEYPNSFDNYRVQKSFQEVVNRGIENVLMEQTWL